MRGLRVLVALVVTTPLATIRAAEGDRGYAIVVSKSTARDPAWSAVVEALEQRHQAEVLSYSGDVATVLPRLRSRFPRYTCFVARPEEAGREFVASVHRLTRQLDDDPYTDTFWAILTGYNADDALRIARRAEPLVIRKVAAGTEIALEACEEGVWYDELRAGHRVVKLKGAGPNDGQGPQDTTQALADALNGDADLFVTSGHATERDWQIGFAYRNGQFRSQAGELFGLDTKGGKIPIDSAHPRVYLAVGNCLMGHIDGPDSMALAWIHSAGVHQMIGYTEPTWFGYGGWGVLDYFVEQPGRFTLTEAFFANQQALVHRLAEVGAGGIQGAGVPASRVEQGLTFDRDVVAFYGDPAWSARMADGPRAWEQSLAVRGKASFQPINTNGSQRGGRPIIAYLPHRIGPAEILEGAELQPVICDDFLLVPNPGPGSTRKEYRIVFQAARRPL